MVIARPPPDKTNGPAPDWIHRQLYDRVIAALHALPVRFKSSLVIEGVPVTDLFTLNTPLGAAIEASVVDSLNGLRDVWDPKSEYASYAFFRQSHAFPDVLLRASDPSVTDGVVMGIELKGWFAIAKEAVPSYRYLTTANACADADLLVVIPWIFDSVVSGKPKLLQPIITEAKYAALMRNHYWEITRKAKCTDEERQVVRSLHNGLYPLKNEASLDRAVFDNGNNFGRIARCGLYTDIEQTLNELALGVPLRIWRDFVGIFKDTSSPADLDREIAKLAARESQMNPLEVTADQRRDLLLRIQEIAGALIASESHPNRKPVGKKKPK